MSKYSVMDLTAGQVESIEQAIGIPVTRWAEAPSLAGLYIKIAAAVNGDGEEKYRAMTTRDLLQLVSIDDEAPDPNPEGATAPDA